MRQLTEPFHCDTHALDRTSSSQVATVQQDISVRYGEWVLVRITDADKAGPRPRLRLRRRVVMIVDSVDHSSWNGDSRRQRCVVCHIIGEAKRILRRGHVNSSGWLWYGEMVSGSERGRQEIRVQQGFVY